LATTAINQLASFSAENTNTFLYVPHLNLDLHVAMQLIEEKSHELNGNRSIEITHQLNHKTNTSTKRNIAKLICNANSMAS
jgi:hypothetical protein